MVNSRDFLSFLKGVLKSPNIFTKNVRLKERLIFTTTIFKRNCGGRVGSNVGAIFEKWRRKFKEESISEPEESIEQILAHCLGTTRISDVYKNKATTLTQEKVKEIDSFCFKRLKHVPIQYILGEWSFRQLSLNVKPPVFIPRPETEQLVDIVLPEIARKKCDHILDICCGSGAIALSLLQENDAIKATALDQSKAACQLTKENAQKNGLSKRIRIIQSQVEHWQWDNKFDIVVSNPPYIYKNDLDSLQPEIKMFEDLAALDGGAEGLDVIKVILSISSQCLNKNGKLFMEVEPRHPSLLKNYLKENNVLGLSYAATYKDFCGKNRFVEIIKI